MPPYWFTVVNTLAELNARNCSGRSLAPTFLVPIRIVITPKNTLAVARVIINGSSFRILINTALISPRRIPIAIEIKNARNRLFILHHMQILKDAYPPNIATAGKDTSIPPEIITTRTPIASMVVPAADLTILNNVVRLKNAGFLIATMMQYTTIIAIRKRCVLSIFFNPFMIAPPYLLFFRILPAH